MTTPCDFCGGPTALRYPCGDPENGPAVPHCQDPNCRAYVDPPGEEGDDDGPNICEACGDDLDRGCDGEDRCPACDGPCPCCDDGGGPAADDEGDDEPAEGDYVLSPCGPLGGRTAVSVIGEGFLDDFADDDAAEAFVRDRMKTEGFFPNVYTQDDHGGMSPRTL